MKKKTTIIKGSKLTTDGEEWSAWDKVLGQDRRDLIANVW